MQVNFGRGLLVIAATALLGGGTAWAQSSDQFMTAASMKADYEDIHAGMAPVNPAVDISDYSSDSSATDMGCASCAAGDTYGVDGVVVGDGGCSACDSGGCEGGACDGGPACGCDDCCACPLVGVGAGAGLTVQLDYLIWQLRSNNLDYAISETNEANRVGVGSIHYVDPGYDSGARTRIGWVCASGWEPAFSYTFFGTSSGASIQRGGVGAMQSGINEADFGGLTPQAANQGRLHSTRLHIQNADGLDWSAASYTFDQNVWDLEIARRVVISESTAVRWFGGFRYADITQRMNTKNGVGPWFVRASSETTNTDAYGLRSGVEGYWTCHGAFSLFGRVAGSVMTADRKYRFLETDNGSSPLEVDLSDVNTDVLPVLEAAIGASYQLGPFEIAFGYELANWFGLGQSMRFVEESPGYDEYPIRQRSDILLDGLFVRLGFYH